MQGREVETDDGAYSTVDLGTRLSTPKLTFLLQLSGLAGYLGLDFCRSFGNVICCGDMLAKLESLECIY